MAISATALFTFIAKLAYDHKLKGNCKCCKQPVIGCEGRDVFIWVIAPLIIMQLGKRIGRAMKVGQAGQWIITTVVSPQAGVIRAQLFLFGKFVSNIRPAWASGGNFFKSLFKAICVFFTYIPVGLVIESLNMFLIYKLTLIQDDGKNRRNRINDRPYSLGLSGPLIVSCAEKLQRAILLRGSTPGGAATYSSLKENRETSQKRVSWLSSQRPATRSYSSRSG